MSEAKWYVVHTYSGYENKVKANIDKTIETRHLEDQILEVRVPLEEVPEIRNGVEKVVQRKMFPGYVMIHMIMNDDTWYVVRNTRGVTGFVGPGSKPVPLDESEMENLGIKQDEGWKWRKAKCCHFTFRLCVYCLSVILYVNFRLLYSHHQQHHHYCSDNSADRHHPEGLPVGLHLH